jgi:hypothetical protein
MRVGRLAANLLLYLRMFYGVDGRLRCVCNNVGSLTANYFLKFSVDFFFLNAHARTGLNRVVNICLKP